MLSQSNKVKQMLVNITAGYSQVKSSFLSVVWSFFMSLSTLRDTSLALAGCTRTLPAERPLVFIVVVTSTSSLCCAAEAERCLGWFTCFFFFFFTPNCKVEWTTITIVVG